MINFEDRLKKLKDRRQGTSTQAIFDSALTEQQRYAALESHVVSDQKSYLKH